VSSYEVILGILLISTEPDSEDCGRYQVRSQYKEIEGGEIGLHFTALDLCSWPAEALRRE
jgi:hypothetical protein